MQLHLEKRIGDQKGGGKGHRPWEFVDENKNGTEWNLQSQNNLMPKIFTSMWTKTTTKRKGRRRWKINKVQNIYWDEIFGSEFGTGIKFLRKLEGGEKIWWIWRSEEKEARKWRKMDEKVGWLRKGTRGDIVLINFR